MPPKTQCGNPLWLSWMEELRDSAREKGIKSAEAYNKACKSLAACPVRYHRPRDLTVLVGIGEKTAQMLEVRWTAYCKDHGLPLPGDIEVPKKKGKGKENVDADTDGILPDSDSEVEGTTTTTKKRKVAPKKPPKQYIPQRGSGGYGILMALVLAIDQPEITTIGYLTKSEIIRTAKEYSDSSYEHSEKGTYFTAWSGMKTLVGKGLVYMTGNPNKFCLTEEGYEVATAIRKLRPEYSHLETQPFVHDQGQAGPSAQLPKPIEPAIASTRTEASSREGQTARPSRTNKFHFWYIDSLGNRVELLSEAMVRLDHDDFINLRKIEYLASHCGHPFASQLRLVDKQPIMREGSSSLYGYVVEDGAPPMCSKFPPVGDKEDQVTTRHSTEAVSLERVPEPMPPSSDGFDGIEDVDVDILAPPQSKAKTKHTSTFSRTASAPGGPSSTSALAAQAALRRLNGTCDTSLSRTQSATDPPVKPRSGPRLSSHIPVATPLMDIEETQLPNIPDFNPDQALIFPAGSYDVVLVLDAREIESKSSRDNFSEAIRSKGINVETRALRLGDVLWIAKRRDGLGGEEDECVLDYVVERKRLDDLCHSIKDGRYTEQCFRLTNSCINHVYYIIEDWDVTNRMQYDGKQIMTAKSQIQVHNRFHLKETTKLSQTIDFLVTMTKVIQSTLSTQDLHIIPTRYLSRSNYTAMQSHLRRHSPSKTYLTSFEAYQNLNDKNASRTLKVAFGRMLLSVKGMSAERVSAILDTWETPRDIWDALKARHELSGVVEEIGEESQKKKKVKVRGPDLFFADTVQGEGRRKVGDALSKELYRVFMGSALDTSS